MKQSPPLGSGSVYPTPTWFRPGELQRSETHWRIDSGVSSVRTHLPTDALPAVSASSGPNAIPLQVEASTCGFGVGGCTDIQPTPHPASQRCAAVRGTGRARLSQGSRVCRTGSHTPGCRVLCSCRKTERFAFAQKPKAAGHASGRAAGRTVRMRLRLRSPSRGEPATRCGERWRRPRGRAAPHPHPAEPQTARDSQRGAGVVLSPVTALPSGSAHRRGYGRVRGTQPARRRAEHGQLGLLSLFLMTCGVHVPGACPGGTRSPGRGGGIIGVQEGAQAGCTGCCGLWRRWKALGRRAFPAPAPSTATLPHPHDRPV